MFFATRGVNLFVFDSLLLTGLMTMWRPERHAFLFILAKFIVIENETKASLKVLYSDVLYGNAPVLVSTLSITSY